MPSRREGPQAANLSALLEGLCKADIEFIVVGGLSAVIQGAPVTTFDLDIVHRQTKENILKLLTFLKSIDACLRRPDDKIIEPTAEDFKAKGHLLLKTKYGTLDVLAFIEIDGFVKRLSSRRANLVKRGVLLQYAAATTR
jgi:hypothetical protein